MVEKISLCFSKLIEENATYKYEKTKKVSSIFHLFWYQEVLAQTHVEDFLKIDQYCKTKLNKLKWMVLFYLHQRDLSLLLLQSVIFTTSLSNA